MAKAWRDGRWLALWAACVLPVFPASAQGTVTLTVEVGNVRNAHGHVHVDICPQPQFLKDDCPWSAEAPARAGTTIVVVKGLPPGRYAAQAFHDENDDHKVNRALFGIPKEGIGFSNDARISFGPPKFADAAFSAGGTDQTIRLNMRYMLGASGPQASR